MALVATTVSNSSLLNIVKAQVVFLLSTLTEDTYERKKAEIRDLCDRHGAEIHVHLLRRLIAASHLRLNLDDPTTSFYDPHSFREAIDKADGQIFLNFDLDRFCERIGLGPLEKLVLASSIISPFTTRRDLVGQASELIQSNFEKSVALLNKTPSFDLDDLSNSAIEKLLSHLVSDSPLMPSILDVQQRHRIISNVQYKIGTEAMGEILEKISSTLRGSSL
ncbi:hypothetical protein DL93DRAFT_723540 [Clavulina sp. PMI_390]|nr:hypothetical protein DL93DRAFT_723540 [Clavulina sp. PMI_390]